MNQAVRIAMVAGETSSDLLASRLMRALRIHFPEASFYGIGGGKMQAEGFDVLWPSELLSVHGFVDALRHYRALSAVREKFYQHLLAEPPDIFIGVDAPDFNFGLETKLKAAGITTVHYISPSIWAWRGGRIHKIARAVDHMLCLFPFEPDLYQKAGIPATYVGHPLADELPMQPDRAAARVKLELPAQVPVFALLPGSRQSEVRHLALSFIETAQLLQNQYPNAQFLVPLATVETQQLFEDALAAYYSRQNRALPALALRVVANHSWEVMTAADVVLVASGTASLEAALIKRPMVISYKVGAISYWIYKSLAYLPWIGLPNILCNEGLVPELLQEQANPAQLAQALSVCLEDTHRRQYLEARFTQLHQTLKQNTAEKAGRVIRDMLLTHKKKVP